MDNFQKENIMDESKSPEVGGRGKKVCKGCGKACGVRTRVCECGFEFLAVAASSENMKIDTDASVKDSLNSAKSILDRVADRNPPKYYGGHYDYGHQGGGYDSFVDDVDDFNAQKPLVDTTIPARTNADTQNYTPPKAPSWYSKPAGEAIDYSQPNDYRYIPKVAGRDCAIPSGDCPVKPKGYKPNWPDGKATPETIKEWALAVYNSDGCKYAPDAVLYWARLYWDINDRPEFGRIRNLIMEAIAP